MDTDGCNYNYIFKSFLEVTYERKNFRINRRKKLS